MKIESGAQQNTFAAKPISRALSTRARASGCPFQRPMAAHMLIVIIATKSNASAAATNCGTLAM